MEIIFLFSFNSQSIKKKINPNRTVSSVLNEMLSQEESLKDIKIQALLCNGGPVDLNQTFKKNKIKNNDTVIVCSDSNEDLEDSVYNLNLEESPYKFKVKKCITKHSHVNLENSDLNAFIDKTLDVFVSLKNEYLLVYSYSENYKDYSLICYNILKNGIVFKRDYAHKERVFTCSHFLDIKHGRDLLLTAAFDKKIKIWNISNNFFELIYKKKPDYYFRKNTYLLCENILSYNNKIYLTTSAYEINSEGYYIFYYSLLGDEIGMFKNSKDNTNYLIQIIIVILPLLLRQIVEILNYMILLIKI